MRRRLLLGHQTAAIVMAAQSSEAEIITALTTCGLARA